VIALADQSIKRTDLSIKVPERNAAPTDHIMAAELISKSGNLASAIDARVASIVGRL
jgi:hypothetical protein